MAGIYIHIPYCKQACHYCDFYFSTSVQTKDAFLGALKREMALRKDYLQGEQINSVYFGGGTPSLLSESELNGIFTELGRHFSIADTAEITLEANPDDLSVEKLEMLKKATVNRLSIGLQSFEEKDLVYMNRSHTAEMGKGSVKRAQDAGFENISVDLIYGTPGLSRKGWEHNLSEVFKLGVQHLSCYALTVEPRTALDHFIRAGKRTGPDEEQSSEHFEVLLEEVQRNNFIQYEISNFALDGFYSRHNSNYWLGETYLGLGPSAHSYDRSSRQWNVRNTNLYIRSLEKGEVDFEREVLDRNTLYNEYVLTSLRTIWGVDLNRMKDLGEGYLSSCLAEAEKYIRSGDVYRTASGLFLSDKGKLIADRISSDLFVV